MSFSIKNSSEDFVHASNSNSSLINGSYQQCTLPELDTTAVKIGKIFAYTILLLFALCGNVVLTRVILKTKVLGKAINCFVVNMAVSDLFIPLIVIPRKITEVITGSALKWLVNGIPGQVLCKLMFFVQDVSTAVSVFSLLFITLNRFTAVVFPFKTGIFNSRVRAFLIALSWLLAGAIFAPYFYTFELQSGPDGSAMCIMQFEDISTTKRYSAAILTVGFIIPFSLLAVLYSMIWVHLKKQGHSLHQVSHKAWRERRNRNVLKMALTIVISFAVCWAPFNVYVFLVIFVWDWKPPFCLPATFQFVAPFMGYTSSAINPCIYFFFVENFRTGLQRLLSRSFSQSSLASNPRASSKRPAVEVASV